MAKAKPAQQIQQRMPIINNLVLGALIAELAGSFILAFAALNTQANPIIAAVTVMVLVLMFSKLSGGHINPVVTISLLATRQIGWKKAVAYLIAQFVGAMLAFVAVSHFLQGMMVPNQYTGAMEEAKIFTVSATDTWRPFFAELLGGAVFGLGIAATFLGKKEGYEAAFTIGGSLLIALFVAVIASHALINPAVALSVGILDPKNAWGIYDYAIAPIVGGVIGALLYQLLRSDISLALRSKE